MTYIALTDLPPKKDYLSMDVVVKIGRSKSPIQRLKQLEQDSTNAYYGIKFALLCTTCELDEGLFHEKLKSESYQYKDCKELYQIDRYFLAAIIECFVSAYDLDGLQTIKGAELIIRYGMPFIKKLNTKWIALEQSN